MSHILIWALFPIPIHLLVSDSGSCSTWAQMETYKSFVNNMKEDMEHAGHEEDFTRETNINIIYSCNPPNKKDLQPISFVHIEAILLRCRGK